MILVDADAAIETTSFVGCASPLQISGDGAVLRIVSSTFIDCASLDDGGSIRAWDGASVTVSESIFQNSSSQVFSMS